MSSASFGNRLEIAGGTVQGFIQENNGTVNQYFISQVSELLTNSTSGIGQPLSQAEYRNRKVLLSKVKQYWIEGVLHRSLHSDAMIKLDLEERSDAVARSVSGCEEISEESRQILPQDTDATQFFHQIGEGRTLLILGEPGAGKTITLLKIAANLIASAEENLSRMIPVILNLSSWASKPQTITEWLVQELRNIYGVSPQIGKDWVEKQQLILLLDGLDEVKSDRREACVQGINQFMQEHGQTEIVVCSRITDYENLSARLQLRGAIFIRSLTSEQVNQYLDKAGDKLQAVKTLLQEDPALQELAKSPLTLRVMTLAYQNKKVEELLQTGSVAERRQDMFNVYIEQMFKREKIDKSSQYKPPYQNQETKLWLSWLAQRMSQSSQTIFLIEQMQPTWLPRKLQRILYRIGSGVIGGVILGFIGTMISCLLFVINARIFQYSQEKLPDPLSMVIVSFFSAALVAGIIIGLGRGKIQPVPSLKWSWILFFNKLGNGLVFGLFLGLFVTGINAVQGLAIALTIGIVTGIMGLVIYAVAEGWKGAEVEKTFHPNQGIRQSIKSSAILGMIGGIIGALGLSLSLALAFTKNLVFTGPEHNLKNIISGGMSYGLVNGMFLGAIFGGVGACVKHLTLRIMLYRNQYIPWNYARFLDYASERIFLQKVGGSYIFIHRMLQEHFADMKKDTAV